MTINISIVIPLFNESEVISELNDRLSNVIIKSNYSFEVIFIDDGSTDDSLNQLRNLVKFNKNYKIISFTRNFGHQASLIAGIKYSCGEYIAIIDADLQDPPELIIDMYSIATTGIDIVYGVRKKRLGESFFKKLSAILFYRLLKKMCDIDIPLNTGDFRLISRRVGESLLDMKDYHLFVRGMVPWLGFKSTPFSYVRHERHAGSTKYPLNKMINFAVNAIFSFSSQPIKYTIKFGLIISLFGVFFGIFVIYTKLFTSNSVAGVTSIISLIIMFGGFQILLIGLLGQYISKIFEQVKGRPLYIINEKIGM